MRWLRFPSYFRNVKGWLGDHLLRLPWALLYWNVRKTFYRLRRGRSQCPCQNPSDSGEPMRTGCDAAVFWAKPGRFRRVCPLLRQNDAGQWVCSVRAEEVRPFWGRAFGYAGGTVATLVVLAVLTLFGLMRLIGYEVSVRQIVWPPAWSELRGVRAQLFIQQARDHYAKGEVREALTALSVAFELEPSNYRVGMMLAQFYQAGGPGLADDMYARMLREQPEHRTETARVWFRSLLVRGRLTDVAELSRRQLEAEPQQASAWTHALVFSARHLNRPELLEEAAADQEVPEGVRPTLLLAAQVQRASPEAAKVLLLRNPGLGVAAYDRVYRIETLLRLGWPEDAMNLLRASRAQLGGRDVARLAFAIYAVAGERERLAREFDALLAPNRDLQANELSLLALHLVAHPDPQLLEKVTAALERVPRTPVEARLEVCFVVFCAAGVQGDKERMQLARTQISDTIAMSLGGLAKLEQFFLDPRPQRRIEFLLPQQSSMSLELNYALLERYLGKNYVQLPTRGTRR